MAKIVVFNVLRAGVLFIYGQTRSTSAFTSNVNRLLSSSPSGNVLLLEHRRQRLLHSGQGHLTIHRLAVFANRAPLRSIAALPALYVIPPKDTGVRCQSLLKLFEMRLDV